MNQIEKYAPMATNDEIKRWITVNLNNYLKKNSEDQGEIEHIIDYLNSDKAPSRLQKMSYDQARSNAEKWTKALAKKGQHIEETENDIHIWETFGEFKLVQLLTENAYKREGFLMSNCVSSYFNSDDSTIFSVRDKNNMPHCTLEIVESEGSIQQIKGKGNGSIDPKYIDVVVKILEFIGLDINVHEFTYLGYHEISEDYYNLMRKVYKEVPIFMYKGNILLYGNRKLVALEA
jgi:hypothetical protein